MMEIVMECSTDIFESTSDLTIIVRLVHFVVWTRMMHGVCFAIV